MKIGQRIKESREKRGWTQEELATRMGYKSRTTINKIELGVNDIPQSKITKFADVLGVSISYLMGLEKESEDLPALNARILKDKKTVEMIDNFYKLDTAEQMAIRTTIEALANKK